MRIFILLVVFILPAFLLQAQDPARFSSEISEFMDTDSKSPPPSGCVLFIGSSSIRMWHTLATDFKKYCVINRGFGGSQISDVNYYFKDIAAPYIPQMVILYAGENDLAAGKTPGEVLADLKIFVGKVREISNQVTILYISAKPSPLRWELKSKIDEFNLAASQYCQSIENVYYIDIFNPMLGKDGRPVGELYVEDNLHMSPKGYFIWKKKISPYLKKYYNRQAVISAQ
ncbi:MAG TPA: GDSL-type esterase/lipase family protein [Cyclobacteriaceae bacterium]|nr:GDSL-type esterase/lipase family protein [Cyclobacteriaceae bacterium]